MNRNLGFCAALVTAALLGNVAPASAGLFHHLKCQKSECCETATPCSAPAACAPVAAAPAPCATCSAPVACEATCCAKPKHHCKLFHRKAKCSSCGCETVAYETTPVASCGCMTTTTATATSPSDVKPAPTMEKKVTPPAPPAPTPAPPAPAPKK
jgi:hypothetical protein